MKSKIALAAILVAVTGGYAQASCGNASWYGGKFHGRKTASGQVFNQNGLTAAHRKLPFGTRVKVTHGSKSVVVRINDRGPFHGNRIIDLSAAAASKIGVKSKGIGKVCIKII